MDINTAFKKPVPAPEPIVQPAGLRLVESDVEVLEGERDPIVEAADQLVVADQPSLDLAGTLLVDRIKPTLKMIDESCGPVVSAAHAARKAATKQRNDLKAPLLEAEKILKAKVGDYLDEQERLRRIEAQRIEDEQRKLREAAEKKARDEAEAEKLRVAEELEEAGHSEAADAVLDSPVKVDVPDIELPPPPIQAPAPQKVQGMSSSVQWGAEVEDLLALVKAVAAGDAPLNLINVDQSKLIAQVRALDGQVNYPGVRVTKKRTVAARASN